MLDRSLAFRPCTKAGQVCKGIAEEAACGVLFFAGACILAQDCRSAVPEEVDDDILWCGAGWCLLQQLHARLLHVLIHPAVRACQDGPVAVSLKEFSLPFLQLSLMLFGIDLDPAPELTSKPSSCGPEPLPLETRSLLLRLTVSCLSLWRLKDHRDVEGPGWPRGRAGKAGCKQKLCASRRRRGGLVGRE